MKKYVLMMYEPHTDTMHTRRVGELQTFSILSC